MESLFILIPIAITFVAIAIAIFYWAAKSGQFEDLDAEGKRILFDEQIQKPNAKTNQNKDKLEDKDPS